ncbi:hypothetical protein KI387_000252, partial [Taxus chinensis]
LDFVNIMLCKFAKEMWDKLKCLYKGDSKVNMTKLQTHRRKFESLKINGEENIVAYILCVDETVNMIGGLGEEMEDP